ncbi:MULTISPECIES: ankyrin repeat domain-containing protein [unclassified Streptomyces]|uniref:ankyrin repeat domain-containing protein n=1 Tax=unclassified Streptomyces TaxID=2593676 RepID=UPI002365EE26|nr:MULTISPECIES: ankyrin repeat domain-containing protein [unclassified Streptomyces]MDF3145967.1 ankyrin repeat domain-containing protein [Streptomyces sp. T21Q-yed]WDF36162.1 ankyrin repeat domain-containing protein [Streptomyces sp. T12]
MFIDTTAPPARAAVEAIRTGDVGALQDLLTAHPGLATARLGTMKTARTLLHVATDWPGHLPNGPATVTALVAAGADVNARFTGAHRETPLHWAASTDDVPVLDALLDLGADIEADGAVIGNGTPLADAVAFGQWKSARRLLERGARTTLWQAAALGEADRVAACCTSESDPPTEEDITAALWCACHGGQRRTAGYLLRRGGDVNWVGYDRLTPLDAAHRSGHPTLVAWLRDQGAKSAEELA